MIIELRNSFRAMNTEVEAIICLPSALKDVGSQALDQVVRLFNDSEKILSRFLPDSELCSLNNHAGQPFEASGTLFEVVAASLCAARITGGLFDPTILSDLQAAGYDKTFESLAETEKSLPPGVSGSCTWKDIRLDHRYSLIRLPEDCRLDLGGIGKGWAVDKAALKLTGYTGFAIDAGGDIVVGGTRADGSPWTVGITDPLKTERDLMVLEMDHGSICTSTTVKRKWLAGGQWRHHLIDPRTGEPAVSDIISATVIAGTAKRAETVAKAAIISGSKVGKEFIDRQPDVRGLLIHAGGELIKSEDFNGVYNVA